MKLDRHAQRRQRARQLLSEFKIDALLITGVANVAYLTGFSGDSTYLLLSGDGDLLISDFRYVTQLEEQCPGVKVRIRSSSVTLPHETVAVLREKRVGRLGIEGHLIPYQSAEFFRTKLDGLELVSVNLQIEAFRAVKDDEEIAEIRRAVALAERGFDFVNAILTPNQTERQLANELEHAMRNLGAEGVSFPTIVAVGKGAALPHYHPADVPVSADPLLLLDWGAQLPSGYKSDLTRTFLTAPKKSRFEKVYAVVLEAQGRAIDAIRPGVKLSEVDAAARDYITEQGFGKRFDHGLGHGIGLDIHELPRFSRSSEGVLQPGMVVTVEPGIYLPGWGGVRIEDDVLVTRDGCEVLSTRVPKDLSSMIVPLR